MALPGDVTTFDLHFGDDAEGYTDVTGAVTLLGTEGIIYPIDLATGERLNLVHVATGQAILPADVEFTLDDGGKAKAVVSDLPHTDNASLSVVGFGYQVEWELASGPRHATPGKKQFAVPTAAGATVDFDLLDVADAAPGVLVPIGVGPQGPAGATGPQGPAGSGGGGNITAGTVSGQIPVWDGDSYEPQSPTAAVAADVPFTPAGTVAATNVQAAIAEVASEATAAIATNTTAIAGKLDTSAAPELIRDTIATALVAGTNVTITPNDGADTITIAATGGGGSLAVQDENGTAITGVTQIDFQGAGVTAASGTGEVVVTIPGASAASPVAPKLRTGYWSTGEHIYVAGTAAAFVSGRLYAAGWMVTEDCTVDQLALSTNATNVGITCKLLVYGSTVDGEPGTKLYESGDVAMDAVNPTPATLGTPLVLTAGQYWLCSVFSSAPTGVRQRSAAVGRPMGTAAYSDANQDIDQLYATTTYVTQPTTFPTIGAHNLAVPAVRAHVASKP